MKVFSVAGISGSGKTTTIEEIIRELRRRNYSVGSVKEIHFEDFAMDEEGTNTDRHYRAGSELVTALGLFETDVLFKRRLDIREVLRLYTQDYVVLEGVVDPCIPRIVTAHTVGEVEERMDGTVFAISGRIAKEIDEYYGIPAIDATTDSRRLVDLVEEKVFSPLPDLAEECCGECGCSCREMTSKILRGDKDTTDCIVLSSEAVQLYVDGQRIEMVPFVQDVLRNVVTGVVSELEGYRKNASIEVRIRHDAPR